eukprot:363682-Chlamydomonas_euryale.AAC.10
MRTCSCTSPRTHKAYVLPANAAMQPGCQLCTLIQQRGEMRQSNPREARIASYSARVRKSTACTSEKALHDPRLQFTRDPNHNLHRACHPCMRSWHTAACGLGKRQQDGKRTRSPAAFTVAAPRSLVVEACQAACPAEGRPNLAAVACPAAAARPCNPCLAAAACPEGSPLAAAWASREDIPPLAAAAAACPLGNPSLGTAVACPAAYPAACPAAYWVACPAASAAACLAACPVAKAVACRAACRHSPAAGRRTRAVAACPAASVPACPAVAR